MPRRFLGHINWFGGVLWGLRKPSYFKIKISLRLLSPHRRASFSSCCCGTAGQRGSGAWCRAGAARQLAELLADWPGCKIPRQKHNRPASRTGVRGLPGLAVAREGQDPRPCLGFGDGPFFAENGPAHSRHGLSVSSGWPMPKVCHHMAGAIIT